MNKLLFLLCFPIMSYAQSNHISSDMKEDDVVFMKIGPFLNNCKDAVAIHKCKYEKISNIESEVRLLHNENDSLQARIKELEISLNHVEFELTNCRNRRKRKSS